MTTHAITAASGHLGHLAVEDLLARGTAPTDIIAVVRTPGRVADLADRGVLVRPGDYSDPASLKTALAGVDKLLLVSGSDFGQRVAQHTNVIEAAGAAGVQRIAYTSILRADTTTNPLAPEHKATEAVLAASGIPSSLLRNSWYLENYTARLAQYLATGQVLGAARDGRVSAASRADYAAAAVAALLVDDEDDHTYELAGASFSFPELATTITEATGTTVTYRDLSTEDLAIALQGAGLDEGTAALFAAVDASIAAGDLFTDRTDLQQLIGRPATTLAEAVRAATA